MGLILNILDTCDNESWWAHTGNKTRYGPFRSQDLAEQAARHMITSSHVERVRVLNAKGIEFWDSGRRGDSHLVLWGADASLMFNSRADAFEKAVSLYPDVDGPVHVRHVRNNHLVWTSAEAGSGV